MTNLRLFVLIFLTGLLAKANAQERNNEIDSLLWHSYDLRFENPKESHLQLKKLIRRSADENYDWGEMKGRMLLGEAYQMIGDVDSCVLYTRSAIIFSNKLGHHKQSAISHNVLSRLESNRGHYTQALNQLDTSLLLFEKIKDTFNITYTHLDIGWIQMLRDDLEPALDNSLLFLRYAEEHQDTSLLSVAYNNIGTIHKKLHNYEKAENIYKKGIALMDSSSQQEYEMSGFYNNLGLLYKSQGRYLEALEQFDKLEKISSEFQDERGLLNVNVNRGLIMNAQKKYSEAEPHLYRAIDLAKKLNNNHTLADAYMLLGESFLQQEKFQEARPVIELALLMTIKIGTLSKIIEARALSKDYEVAIGNLSSALAETEIIQELKDSLFHVERTKQVNELHEKYEAAEKDAQIKSLTLEAEWKEKKRQLMGWIIASIGALLLTVAYLIFQRLQKQKQLMKGKLLVQAERQKSIEEELNYKSKELSTHILQLKKKNEFLAEQKKDLIDVKRSSRKDLEPFIDRLIRKLDHEISNQEFWQQFTEEFKIVHKDFLSRIKQDNVQLSKTELRLVALLRMNLSSKEIAHILNVSGEGVKKGRQRLRKKLELPSALNLQEYIINL